jgi:hypothetical protein
VNNLSRTLRGERLSDRLRRLLNQAFERDVCLKVLISGMCSHPHNRRDYMHTCGLTEGSHTQHCCKCGKVWTEVKCSILT